ncbi:hypothetical protein EHI8A_097830 [Entamoeba histolytica HM-1:IMSS-B]|uniref:RRP12 HEAT domain-containing protein n=6 Tax=Entamoeba histolytica TaxID=5759 RepID=C4LV26_ENTH1|nr:hypothetical protein EHI_092660 [Entamoeba histolytica HM-1:IMSS]EMD47910.1 Hypothetical protein EHI5A_058470 [Entamoeba histolytica KU27]EMH74397.1 hypothetical protein EHI8A_097830 [Entamoeba histolytica HM-1:IMSS-B]EMS17203.1 hypothetical protein KM1_173240 [Entamoeba histolytica HM-3:IMSS]ENY64169.1 hypothetical protein EHI7A_094350 [Entamoeba histolytica HM-1:IMSS-A]GAT92500.1 hypothetical protein CL6EHI_092660 [Entamoeba histolytica]|eukprot:XP_650677.1 hypothetical protein EHI_092660 [Entamoeba histolytica HM-1:IMSS]
MEEVHPIFDLFEKANTPLTKATLLSIETTIQSKKLEINNMTVYSLLVELINQSLPSPQSIKTFELQIQFLLQIIEKIPMPIIANDLNRILPLINGIQVYYKENTKNIKFLFKIYSSIIPKIPKSSYEQLNNIMVDLFESLETIPDNCETAYDQCIVTLISESSFKSSFGKKLVTTLLKKLSSKNTSIVAKTLHLISRLLSKLSGKLANSLINKLTELSTTAVETPLLVALYKSYTSALMNKMEPKVVEAISNSLINHPPTSFDIQSSIAYSTTLFNLPIAISKYNTQLACETLETCIRIVGKYYLDAGENAKQYTDLLGNILTRAFTEPFVSIEPSPVKYVISYVVETLFNKKNHLLFEETLKIAKKLFIHGKPNFINQFAPLLTLMNKFYENTAIRESVEKCLISSFEHLGVKCVLEILPLNLDVSIVQRGSDGNLINHSYLISVLLKCHLREELKFYYSLYQTCIPMINKLIAKSIELNTQVETKNLQIIKNHFISLLLVFMNDPTDYEYFPEMTDLIIEYLNDEERTKLGCDIINRAILHHIKQPEVIQKMSQKLVLTLFNVLSKKTTVLQQKPILKCIENILKQTQGEMANILFKNVIVQIIKHKELLENDITIIRTVGLINLSILFIPALNESSIEIYLNALVPMLTVSVQRIVKSTLKALAELTRLQGTYMFNKHRVDIETWFVMGTYNDKVYERAILRGYYVYLEVIKSLSRTELNQKAVEFLALVIRLTKENNRKTREESFEMIDKMGVLYDGHYSKVLEMICAFIGEDPHITSCAFIALGRFLIKGYDHLSENTKKVVFDICINKLSKSREENKSIISTIKALLKLDNDMFKERMPDILNAFGKLNEDNRRYYRMEIKQFIEKLIRKYGEDTVEEGVVGVGKELIQMAKKYRKDKKRRERKEKERGKNIKGKNEDNEEDIIEGYESEDENEEKDERKRMIESEDVDLLQMKFVKETVPKKMRKIGETDFPVDAEGKLVVNEEEQNESEEGVEEEQNEDGMEKEKKVVEQKTPKTRTFERKLLKKKLEQSERKKRINDEVGKRFKAKKAQGDVMKNGVQPYAYVPLKRSTKKTKLETETAFKTLMKKDKGSVSLKKPIRLSRKRTIKK